MSIDDYRVLQRNNGPSRVVIVQPKHYGTDNRCTLDAIVRFGSQARVISVVHPAVSDDELQTLADGGIRGGLIPPGFGKGSTPPGLSNRPG